MYPPSWVDGRIKQLMWVRHLAEILGPRKSLRDDAMTVPKVGSLVAQMVKSLPAKWRPGFDPWVGKTPWSREWQPTPGFLPGESHGQRSLGATVHGVAKIQTVGHD